MALTLRTLAQCRADMRLLLRDTDTSSPTFQDSDYNDFWNQAYVQLKTLHEDRIYEYDSTTLGLQFSTGETHKYTSETQVKEIISIYLASGATAVDGPELERMELEEIIDLQNSDPTQGTPTRYAISRYQKSVANATIGGFFAVWLHPIPDAAAYIAAHVKLYVAQLTSDTQKPDSSDEEQRVITLSASAQMAKIMGHEQSYVDWLWGQVPERYQGVYKSQQRVMGPPRIKPTEATR